MQPGDFVLGTTVEKLEVPDDLLGNLEGRSSIGRLGIIIHSTAASIDPGMRDTYFGAGKYGKITRSTLS